MKSNSEQTNPNIDDLHNIEQYKESAALKSISIDPAADADNPICEDYDKKRHPLLFIKYLTKDELVRYDNIDCSALVFVLEGTVRVSTGVYIKQTVGGVNVFVAHERDNVLIHGIDDTVMLYCFFNSSMDLCNGLSLKASDDAQIKKVRHRPKDELPTLPIPKLLMEELGLTRKELASNLLDIRFMELKRYIILMMLRKLFHRDDLIYMFRYKTSEDFEFRELVFHHYRCDVNAQELAALTGVPIATFNRKFKKTFGMSAKHWLNTRREISILMDLTTTDMTIKKIAAKYNLTPNYLSNFCKKHLGDTPSSFREKD